MTRYIFYIATILLLWLQISETKAQIAFLQWSQPKNIDELNSKADDFAPAWNKYSQELFFNSLRKGNSLFYKAKLNKDYSFTQPILLTDGINKTDKNQSYITFANNELAYFVSSRTAERGSVFNIFSSHFNKNNWNKGEIVKSLQSDNFCFQPTIAPNGNFMIFSFATHDNPDDADLWLALRDNKNEWGNLIKLDELNSNGAEITPFLASDDTLYFSSNGFNGKGGFDIYLSVNIDGVWQKPRPVTELNTEFDESDFTLIDAHTAIFSSNRPNGKGGLDLWLTHLEAPTYTNFPTSINLSSLVTDINLISSRNFIYFTNYDDYFKTLPNIELADNLSKIYTDSIFIQPQILEIHLNINDMSESDSLNLSLQINNQSYKIEQCTVLNYPKIINIDLNKYIQTNNLPDSIVFSAEIVDKPSIPKKQIDFNVFKSQKEKLEEVKINNVNYNIYLLPLPKEISEESLDKNLKNLEIIKKQITIKKKVIIESSHTFSLSENQTIRNWFEKKMSEIKDLDFQKNIFPKLNKYLQNKEFNYLLIFIQN